MNELQVRKKMASKANSFIGVNEADGSHKAIIDVYNSHKPLAAGYKVKYTDEWCATFTSAVAIMMGYTDIIPTECSCNRQINLWKKKGRWQENDAYIPSIGDFIYYDWHDTGAGDCVGFPDHVGLVTEVSGLKMTIVEGNMSNKVGKRTIAVNAKFIRGFGLPSYASKATASSPSTPVTKPQRSVSEVAKEVLAGKWGNGADRKKALESEGYSYAEVQVLVNKLAKETPAASPKKSTTDIAKEVIAGKWGNGDTRKQKLKAAGYDYSEVQKKVNELI